MITATGLGSGLDINGMVTQLLAAERSASDQQLSRENTRVNTQLSAFGRLKGAVSGLQSALAGIQKLSNFDQRKASSSDEDRIGISATSKALPNGYRLEVTQLADSHALASMAFPDKDETALGSGTLSIRFGTTDYDAATSTYNGFVQDSGSTTLNIAIDSSNNTLEGIMQAINAADGGVRASIVNDGNGYRLLLSSEATGAARSMELSVADDDGDATDAAGLSRFAFSASATHLQQTRAAQDAKLSINGLAINSASNEVSEAIEGVTLSLSAVTESPVEVKIEKDDSAVRAGLKSFMDGYNKYIAAVRQLGGYNAATKVAGDLQGDFTLRSIQQQVDLILRNPVPGLSGDFSTLFELGITSKADGTLALDSAKLDSALAERPEQVKALLATFGSASDPGIHYVSSGQASVGEYAVEISALATRGSLSGAAVLPDFASGGALLIDADNDAFKIEVNGVEAAVTLTHGSYGSAEALVAELQSQINASKALEDRGIRVTVTMEGGALVLTSDQLGSESRVAITAVDSGSAASLGLSVAEGIAGTDVAGSIGGQSAVGRGDVLSGAEDSAMAGLSIRVDGGEPGERGSLRFTRGLGDLLDTLLDGILDGDGPFEERIDALNDRTRALSARRERLELRWEAVEERYRRQFNQLDAMLAQMNSTSTFLQQQLESIAQIGKKK